MMDRGGRFMPLDDADFENIFGAARRTWFEAEKLRLAYEINMISSMKVGRIVKMSTFIAAIITVISSTISVYVSLAMLTLTASVITAIITVIVNTYTPEEALKKFASYNQQLVSTKKDLEFLCYRIKKDDDKDEKMDEIEGLRDKVIQIEQSEPIAHREEDKERARNLSFQDCPCGTKLFEIQEKNIQKFGNEEQDEELASDIRTP